MRKNSWTGALVFTMCAWGFTTPAAVDGFVITLANSSYTVPAGKVLVLRAYQKTSTTGAAYLTITAPGASISQSWSGSTITLEPMFLASPLRFPQGTKFANASGSVTLYGDICETQDLYAGLTSRLEQPAVAGGSFQGKVELSAAVQPDVRIQSSTNLSNWRYDNRVIIAATGDRKTLSFVSPKSNAATAQYYRAVVRKRAE